MNAEDREAIADMPGGLAVPHYPIFILGLAALSDFVDALSGGFFGIATSFTLGTIVWFWIKTHPAPIQKHTNSWLVKRMLLVLGIDSIPVLSAFLPGKMFLVHSTHRRRVRAIRKLRAVYGV